MTRKDTGSQKRSCHDCPNTFEMIPPIDSRYTIPRDEKPENGEYRMTIGECESGHINKIYWVSSGKRFSVGTNYKTRRRR